MKSNSDNNTRISQAMLLITEIINDVFTENQ